MQSIKKEFSRDANYIIEGDIPECRLQWEQYSPRYKKQFPAVALEKYHRQFSQKYDRNRLQFPPFKWQKSFRDHIVRNDKDLYNHLEYIQNNWIKHKIKT